MLLTEICQEIRNWFDRGMPKYHGEFKILNGSLIISDDIDIVQDQYYRIIGSRFNDGVHINNNTDSLKDETFNGTVWAMSIPQAVINLANDIEAWQNKYGGIDSQAMSPFASESFGGYSYTKGGGSSSSGGAGGNGADWRSVFGNRLDMWRKI